MSIHPPKTMSFSLVCGCPSLPHLTTGVYRGNILYLTVPTAVTVDCRTTRRGRSAQTFKNYDLVKIGQALYKIMDFVEDENSEDVQMETVTPFDRFLEGTSSSMDRRELIALIEKKLREMGRLSESSSHVARELFRD